MNYKKEVLKERETVLTRDQRKADFHVYSRTTRDGQELYFRRYGTHTDIAHDPIDFDNDCVTELYEIEELLKETILETGNTIYLCEYIEDDLQIHDNCHDFWQEIFEQID
mgnify:FL=1